MRSSVKFRSETTNHGMAPAAQHSFFKSVPPTGLTAAIRYPAAIRSGAAVSSAQGQKNVPPGKGECASPTAAQRAPAARRPAAARARCRAPRGVRRRAGGTMAARIRRGGRTARTDQDGACDRRYGDGAAGLNGDREAELRVITETDA